jgi:hypothetical protein
MPRLKGLFDNFQKLDSLQVEGVKNWLNRREDPALFENELGNRIVYPQTVPVTQENLIFDLAILREALKLQPEDYYNQNFHRLYIPENFLNFIPDIHKLVLAFIDTFDPWGVTTIFLRSERLGTMTLGTLIRPEIISDTGWIDLWVYGKKYEVPVGSITFIPAANNKIDIKFESGAAKLFEKNQTVAEVIGGQLGVIVDTRKISADRS